MVESHTLAAFHIWQYPGTRSFASQGTIGGWQLQCYFELVGHRSANIRGGAVWKEESTQQSKKFFRVVVDTQFLFRLEFV